MTKLIYLTLIISIFACNGKHKKTASTTLKESVNNVEAPTESVFFNYKPDIRIFTVLAFANAAGYDPFFPDSISNERKEIRLYLDSILSADFKHKIKAVFKQEKRHRFIIPQIYFALNLSYPPNIKLLHDSLKAKLEAKPIKNTEQYLKLLNEFYIKADMPKLWAKYSAKLEHNNRKFAPYANKAISNITDYCRIDSNFYSKNFVRFNFYEEQLANKGWGSIFNSNDTIFYFMNYQANGNSAFYHESLHLLINPITDRNFSLLKKYEKIVKVGFERRCKFGAYIHLSDLFSESMVATVDLRLREKYDNYSPAKSIAGLDKEYEKGLVLVYYFYEKLKEYEKSVLSLEEYYPSIISGINIEAEKEKWKKFNDKI